VSTVPVPPDAFREWIAPHVAAIREFAIAVDAVSGRHGDLPSVKSRAMSELEDGDVDKLVITQRNRVRAVVVSVERCSEVERALDGRTVPGRYHLARLIAFTA
jgi:hypothetical protein